MLDSTVVSVHPDAARGEQGDPPDEAAVRQALGRSRGDLTTKLRAAVDGLGHPLRLALPPGQAGDAPQAAARVAGCQSGALLADAAYDSDVLRGWARSVGAVAVIPSNPSRARKPTLDREVAVQPSPRPLVLGGVGPVRLGVMLALAVPLLPLGARPLEGPRTGADGGDRTVKA